MYIDLTVDLNPHTPIYPGDPVTKIEPTSTIEKDGYTDHYLSFATHAGTHIDAPLHMMSGGKTLDRYDVNTFIGRGRYIKVSNNKFDLNSVIDANITTGDIVLFHTGWAARYHDPEYFNEHPAMSEDIAHYLVGKKIKMVGMDMSGPDHEPFPIHKILLMADVLIAENLCNLEKLAEQDFMIYALPIKLQLDGAPARVIADLI